MTYPEADIYEDDIQLFFNPYSNGALVPAVIIITCGDIPMSPLPIKLHSTCNHGPHQPKASQRKVTHFSKLLEIYTIAMASGIKVTSLYGVQHCYFVY